MRRSAQRSTELKGQSSKLLRIRSRKEEAHIPKSIQRAAYSRSRRPLVDIHYVSIRPYGDDEGVGLLAATLVGRR
jgi:hypothetical protein